MIDRLSMSATSGEHPVVAPPKTPDSTTGDPLATGTIPLNVIDDPVSAPVAAEVVVVVDDAAAEQSLVAWEPDLRIADEAASPGEGEGEGEGDAGAEGADGDERPSQSRFFADAEARRLSRIKR